jgi:hypothetical protein
MSNLNKFGVAWDYLEIEIVKRPEDNIFLNLIDWVVRGFATIVMKIVKVFDKNKEP